eukprot:jgi/Mesvir1/11499/Mv13852-RA.1
MTNMACVAESDICALNAPATDSCSRAQPEGSSSPSSDDGLPEKSTAVADSLRKASKRGAGDSKHAKDPEEKIKSLQDKLFTQAEKLHAMEKELAKANRRADQLQKEKDMVLSDLSKTQAIKGKLETLCRELQKENKNVMELSQRNVELEKERRRQFQETVDGVSRRLEEHDQSKAVLAQENELLREKVKKVLEQITLRDEYVASQLKAKEVEIELGHAKLAHEVEVSKSLEAKCAIFAERFEVSRKSEAELRQQLESYAGKFESFQTTLAKSNEVFTMYKSQMETMTKSITKLKKENAAAKAKVAIGEAALKEAEEQKAGLAANLALVTNQKKSLEALCRSLRAQLPSSGTPAPSSSTEASQPSPPPATTPDAPTETPSTTEGDASVTGSTVAIGARPAGMACASSAASEEARNTDTGHPVAEGRAQGTEGGAQQGEPDPDDEGNAGGDGTEEDTQGVSDGAVGPSSSQKARHMEVELPQDLYLVD